MNRFNTSCRIYPVSSAATPRKKQEGELGLKERWYPIQVKQKDKAGRPDIDAFEAMMMREDCEKGFFVSFDYSSDALQEIESFFKRSHKVIVALTDLICTSSLNPAFSPRRRRIVRRPLENSRDWIGGEPGSEARRHGGVLIRLCDGSQRRPEIHRQQLWPHVALRILLPILFPIIQRRHGDFHLRPAERDYGGTSRRVLSRHDAPPWNCAPTPVARTAPGNGSGQTNVPASLTNIIAAGSDGRILTLPPTPSA